MAGRSCQNLEAYADAIEAVPDEWDMPIVNGALWSKWHRPLLRMSFDSPVALQSSRSMARREGELNQRDLLGCSGGLLANKGRLSVIVPVNRLEELQSVSAEFALRRVTLARPLPEQPYHRVLVELSAVSGFCERDELTIETVHYQYSPTWVADP